jgi:hypothetical protein
MVYAQQLAWFLQGSPAVNGGAQDDSGMTGARK